MLGNPVKLRDDFEEAEKDACRTAKAKFEASRAGTSHCRKYRGSEDVVGSQPEEPDTFMSFEEDRKNCEELHYGFANELGHLFAELFEKLDIE